MNAIAKVGPSTHGPCRLGIDGRIPTVANSEVHRPVNRRRRTGSLPKEREHKSAYNAESAIKNANRAAEHRLRSMSEFSAGHSNVCYACCNSLWRLRVIFDDC